MTENSSGNSSGRGTRHHRFRLAAAVVVAVVSLATPRLVAAQPDPEGAIVYQPPVSAPVVDPFRPPERAYGPGNRGLTYELAPHTAVRSSADGTVSFAGTVAGTLHVTVAHADGLRSSYSFLSAISVRRGERVDAGDVVGYAGSGFHFGVRDGDTYLDPAALFGEAEVRARLIPHDPLPPTPAKVAMDRRALRELVAEMDRGLIVTDVLTDIVDAGYELAGLGAEHVYEALRIRALTMLDISRRLNPVRIARKAREFVDRLRRDCTQADVSVAVPSAQARVAVTVAGYGSDSDAGAVDEIDTNALGYADGDVVRYSYRGGRVPGDVADDLSGIAQHEYSPRDTFADLRQRGVALADLIANAAALRPGVPVDVYAHSQGGIVTRLALIELEKRHLLDRLGVVVTIGTPHGGADLASAAVALSPLGDLVIREGAEMFGAHVDPDARSVHQMAEYSELQHDLAEAGVPDGVDFRTVGARGDLVVPAARTTVRDEVGAIVDLAGPSAHAALPGDPATTRELVLALAGKPTACDSPVDTFLDMGVPELVIGAEDLVTLFASSV